MQLASRCVSGEHAVVFWDERGWHVRDLGSTNGTHVDGRAARAGERVAIGVGAVIRFGDDEERWSLEDDARPSTRARCPATGDVRTATDGLLALPDATDPRATLFEDGHGRWNVEAEGDVRLARDQEELHLDGATWILEVCSRSAEVSTTRRLSGDPKVVGAMTLRFEVSRDGEHIALSLVRGEDVLPLGGRAHHEVLLLLARARLRDREAGQAPAEQGWLYVDEVLDALKIDLQHFNVNVFRARQHFAQVGVLDAGALFERRTTTRQIRVGTGDIEIVEP